MDSYWKVLWKLGSTLIVLNGDYKEVWLHKLCMRNEIKGKPEVVFHGSFAVPGFLFIHLLWLVLFLRPLSCKLSITLVLLSYTIGI